MRHLPILLAFLVGCGRAPEPPLPRPSRAADAPAADVRAAAAGSNAFALGLHRRLGGGNVFFSPLSVSTALGMTYVGARGETATEMAKALHYPFEGERLHVANAGLLGRLADARLTAANGLWGPHEYDAGFLKLNRECYGAEPRAMQLKGAEPAINRWVAERTNERIKDLLPPGSLDERTQLLLVNAVYFKAPWMSAFNAGATREQEFRPANGSAVRVPTMYQAGSLRHAQADGVQVLELPYRSGLLSMVVILPDADDGLAAVEKELTAEKLERWIEAAGTKTVLVHLPRFKIVGRTVTLKEPLADLGMKKAFAPGADFSGVGVGDLYVDQVYHQAFVEVNEEGTEAAAATASQDKGKDGPGGRGLVAFRADHPFLFLIRDRETGCILFLGRLADPGSAATD